MHLPFNTTFAIFIGGLIKLASDKFLKKRSADDKQKIKVAHVGILVASGFIAGEALTGVLLAALVLLGIPSITSLLTGQNTFDFAQSAVAGWLSILIFGIVILGLIRIPLSALKN